MRIPSTRAIAGAALITAAWGGAVWGQGSPPAPVAALQENQPNAVAPCVQPAPMVRWEDYDGRLRKVAGAFGRRLERKSTRAPHYKPGAVLCALTLRDKFLLTVRETSDPVTFLGIAYNAGISQAERNDPSYGQGAAGYGKRFGAGLAGAASSQFFKDLLYPTIFSQDPRYYRRGHGSATMRFLHAVKHSVVAYREDSTQVFNFTEWLGTTSAVVLSNTYHPDNKRGVGPAATRVGYSVGGDIGFDVLREFWPEIARKFRLPFRGQNELESPETGSEKKLRPCPTTCSRRW
jgi:hypothetical protein